MNDTLAETRLHQLLRSPAGCALLFEAVEAGMTPAEVVEPVTALHLVANAIGAITPWRGDHAHMVELLLREAKRHRGPAEALVRAPGIERWWAPLDRDRQVWMEPESRIDVPAPDTFPTPDHPPTRQEMYAQRPFP